METHLAKYGYPPIVDKQMKKFQGNYPVLTGDVNK